MKANTMKSKLFLSVSLLLLSATMMYSQQYIHYNSEGKSVISLDKGRTWINFIQSDKLTSNYFHINGNNERYVSTDAGKKWKKAEVETKSVNLNLDCIIFLEYNNLIEKINTFNSDYKNIRINNLKGGLEFFSDSPFNSNASGLLLAMLEKLPVSIYYLTFEKNNEIHRIAFSK